MRCKSGSKSSLVVRFFIIVPVVLFFTIPIKADVLNVPSAPYPTIQDGINAAGAGDTVQVAAGTYYERITLKSDVYVLGAGKIVTTINGQSLGVVVTATNVNSAAKLDGFTITNGSSVRGGGIYLNNGDLTISNCRILTNQTSGTLAKGGGIYCSSGSSATIENCNILLNTSKHGGGIYIDNCAPTISNCQIYSNTATGDDHGGGIYLTGSSSSGLIIDCAISDNDGSGVRCGIYSHPTIESCTITGNDAYSGAGIDCYSSTPRVLNTVIANNTAHPAAGMGGGIYSYFRDPTIVNCVFYNNSAYRGSVIYYWQCTPVIYNSILWVSPAATGFEIYSPAPDSISITYCDVEGGFTGTGNISTNPDFVNAPAGDFHLAITSNCINNGTATGAPEYDFEGDPRLASVGGDNVPDIGIDETIFFSNPPADLQAHQTSDRIHLTWQDNSDDETGFRIESKVGVFGSWNTLATVDADTTFYQSGYSMNFEYFYRVVAENATGDSMYSNVASIYALGILNWLRLDLPGGGEVWTEDSTQSITWSYGMAPPTHVNLYYSTDTQCTWKLIEADVLTSARSYNWTVATEPSNTCMIKIESASNADKYDLSNEYFTVSASPDRFEFIQDTWTHGFSFGGDDRPKEEKNRAYGQYFIPARSAKVLSAGFDFWQEFDYAYDPEGTGHEVTLVLNVCSEYGTIISTANKTVPADFAGGWVIFNLDVFLWAGQKYIFTCYMQNAHTNDLFSLMLGSNTDPLPLSYAYNCNVSSSPYDMEDWSNWSVWNLIDMNFQIGGVYTDQIKADWNEDYTITLADFATFAEYWMRDDCVPSSWCDQTDFDYNGSIGLSELDDFANYWMQISYGWLNYGRVFAMKSGLSDQDIDGSDGNEFWPGTYFIYRTNNLRYGKLVVEDYNVNNSHTLTLSWTTYNSDGSIYSSGTGLQIPQTWTCDLDIGIKGPISGTQDFWWVNTGTKRYIQPSNGALFKLIYRAE